MKAKPIYTLDFIKREAEGIASSWNGEDARFSYEGDVYTEDDAHAAMELLKHLEKVEKFIKELNL
jgi:hypothetical protein